MVLTRKGLMLINCRSGDWKGSTERYSGDPQRPPNYEGLQAVDWQGPHPCGQISEEYQKIKESFCYHSVDLHKAVKIKSQALIQESTYTVPRPKDIPKRVSHDICPDSLLRVQKAPFGAGILPYLSIVDIGARYRICSQKQNRPVP